MSGRDGGAVTMGEELAGRIPPHNFDAERSLLGAMLLSRDAVGQSVEITEAAHFYRPVHGHIYDAICALYAGGQPTDPVSVAEELSRNQILDMVGGLGYLLELQALTPAAASAPRYARIVEERALLRRLIGVAGEIAEMGYSVPTDVQWAVAEAERKIFDVAGRRLTDTTRPIRQLLSDTLDRLEELYEAGNAITGIPTGFVDLDRILSGMQPSNLIVVGARPSMGKTSFALGVAGHVAVHAGLPVLVFSLEMGHLELTQRLLCSEALVDSSRMRNGQLKPDDWTRITKSVGRLAEAELFIDDNPQLTVMEIAAKARRLKAELRADLGLIVVDYLQLMTGHAGRTESRQLEVAEISRGLKILARELKTPVMALSQLSRNLEQRADRRPQLADLRESGSIEQDADVVMFIFREEVYNPEPQNQGKAEIIVAKHRNGPIGHVELAFLNHYTKFANAARA